MPESGGSSQIQTQRFAIDYTFWLNLAFLAVTGFLAWLRFGGEQQQQGQKGQQGIFERFLFWLAILCYLWLAGGIVVSLFQ